jgi:hypothetical protein
MRSAQGSTEEDEWYKFDGDCHRLQWALCFDRPAFFLTHFPADDKVSIVNKDKILALDGGGEDSVAYILLYRSPEI